MRKRAVMFMLAALLLIPGMASATTYILGDLMSSGDAVVWGDKIFDDFSLTSATGYVASNFTVTPSNIGDVYYLAFGGPFTALAGQAPDYVLKYSVAVDTALSGKRIGMIDQSFVLSWSGDAGVVIIGEFVYDNASFTGTPIAKSSISFNFPNEDYSDPPSEGFGENLYIDPALVKVWVAKDIQLIASNTAGSSVGATSLTQSFHQVPEPATLLLLGFGLIGLAGIRRKFKSSKS